MAALAATVEMVFHRAPTGFERLRFAPNII
jgi:hypothetical protein